jgi:hypothetical protein
MAAVTAPALRYRSTAAWWLVGSTAVVLLITVGLIFWLRRDVTVYERAYAAAEPGTTGTVAKVEDFRKGSDLVWIEWAGGGGERHRRVFEVHTATDFHVGEQVGLRIDPRSPDVAYPQDRDRFYTSDDLRYAIIGLIIAAAAFTLALGWRAIRWWRAARTAGHRRTAQIKFSYGRGGFVAIPWVIFEDGGRTYYQRVAWEPWIELLGSRGWAIEAHRSGRVIVTHVLAFGRLWPAGRARLRDPFLVTFEDLDRGAGRYSRLAVLGVVLVGGFTLLVVGVRSAIAGIAYAWLILQFFGGGAMRVRWLRPRSRPGWSSTPAAAPGPAVLAPLRKRPVRPR